MILAPEKEGNASHWQKYLQLRITNLGKTSKDVLGKNHAEK